MSPRPLRPDCTWSVYHSRRAAGNAICYRYPPCGRMHGELGGTHRAMAYDIEYARGSSWPLLRIPRSIRGLPASLSPAPKPGLIVLNGSEGALSGWTDVVAVEFAYRGFVTYAHPYSRGGNFWQAGDI